MGRTRKFDIQPFYDREPEEGQVVPIVLRFLHHYFGHLSQKEQVLLGGRISSESKLHRAL